MEQFALTSVYPRSLAWLIRLDEWDRLEKTIKYNCAMVGGYFNIFIPLASKNMISENYVRFLIDFDPDLIILAPDMKADDLGSLKSQLHPFAIILWEEVSQVLWPDAWGGGSGLNATLGPNEDVSRTRKRPARPCVAVGDKAYSDTSRLALVACGEAEPREPMLQKMDDDISLDAIGHRELFLSPLLKSDNKSSNSVEAYVDDEGSFVPAPDRFELFNMIERDYQFPLSDGASILETCCRLQAHIDFNPSFVGMTAYYKRSGNPRRKQRSRETPAIVILISSHFDMQEAVLFWNLRASGFFVSWLSFDEIDNNPDTIAKWLDSDYGGIFYSLIVGGGCIAFSSPVDEITRLEVSLNILSQNRRGSIPDWRIVSYDELIVYDYQKPHIKQGPVSIVEDKGKYTFIPLLINSSSSGIYTTLLEWDGLMLPQNETVVNNLISSEYVKGFLPIFRNGRRVVHEPIKLPKFRITADRFLEVQISDDQPITFQKPSPAKVIETLFKDAGYSRLELSSTARYHQIFLERISGIDNVQRYLAASPYRELLELLSNSSDEGKRGWILKYPECRVLHHLQLWEALGKVVPQETKKYIDKVSDILPEEAIRLLEMRILERGFLLSCSTCAYQSWYPAEHVGQTFECARCFQTQIYRSNPLWLYKLPEVIFQGFKHNLQVPLLALWNLKYKSQHCFEWMPDSDVFWEADGQEKHKNIDLLCLSDGRLYIGEAKSSHEVEQAQFTFYEVICKRVQIDGIVFATSKPQWNRAMYQRIEQLRAKFSGEIIVLTRQDLYNAASE